MKINVLELDIRFLASAIAITNLGPDVIQHLDLKVSLVQPVDSRIHLPNKKLTEQVCFINPRFTVNACRIKSRNKYSQ